MALPDRHAFETGLDATQANFVPLSPVSFLTRAATAFADKVAVVDGERRYTYTNLLDRSVRLAGALSKLGVGRLDTVAILASNIPELIEALYAVPMLGAVLNPLNTRLDAANIAFSLKHGGAKVFLVERDFATLVEQALQQLDTKITLVAIDTPDSTTAPPVGQLAYEALLANADPTFEWPGIDDEWQSLCLLYTSGTTGDTKGVVYSHRGAYLSALGNGFSSGHIPSHRRTSSNPPLRRADSSQYACSRPGRAARALQPYSYDRDRWRCAAVVGVSVDGSVGIPRNTSLRSD